MTTCTVRRISYEERNGRLLFVADPANRGRYLLTDPCVVLRACPQCHAVQYEPCKRERGNYTAGTHWARRERGDRAQAFAIGDFVVDEEITIEPLEDVEAFPYLG